MRNKGATPELADAMIPTQDMFRDIDESGRSGIGRLIDHLLGGGGVRMHGDAGLSRFSEGRLIAIQQCAEGQAEECLGGLQSISHVLGVAASHPQAELPSHVLFALAEHLHGQSQALERWIELANNAEYLKKNRRIADDLARRYALWSASLGEWPERD